jgi:hypothetical protein
MIQSAADVERLLASELARITQRDLVELVQRLRVKPRCENRPWDYGRAGQTYPCWIVFEHVQSNTCVVYCSRGFGPRCPWGLLFLQEHLGMGEDCQWFTSLEDAVRDSMAWEGDNPPGFEKQ